MLVHDKPRTPINKSPSFQLCFPLNQDSFFLPSLSSPVLGFSSAGCDFSASLMSPIRDFKISSVRLDLLSRSVAYDRLNRHVGKSSDAAGVGLTIFASARQIRLGNTDRSLIVPKWEPVNFWSHLEFHKHLCFWIFSLSRSNCDKHQDLFKHMLPATAMMTFNLFPV